MIAQLHLLFADRHGTLLQNHVHRRHPHAPFGVAQFEDDTFLPKMCGKQENLEALSMEATAKAIIFPDEGK